MFSLSSSLKSRHCLLHLPTILVDSESKRKFNKLRLDALSTPHCVIKKGRCHGARHGKTEEQKEYHVAWNAWKRCCKKVHSQGGHITGIHDRFLRDPVHRESQLAIGWSEQKCKRWTNLQQKTIHVISLQRNLEDTKDNGISPWTSQAKMGRWDFDPIFELLSLSKIVSTASQASKLKNPFLQNNTVDGILLQAHRGGTSLNGIGSELIRFF